MKNLGAFWFEMNREQQRKIISLLFKKIMIYTPTNIKPAPIEIIDYELNL